MKLHRYKVVPRSPWGTPLRSDTLCGLMLYRIAEDEGEAAVGEALEAFRAGTPPFVVSSALPEGAVFAPRLPALSRVRFRKLAEQGSFAGCTETPLVQVLQQYKEFRKQRFLPESIWRSHAHDLRIETLFRAYCASRWEYSEGVRATEAHVSIDRRSGTAFQGGLYMTDMMVHAEGSVFSLYVRTEDPGRVQTLLERIGSLGFGRDAGVGKGLFSVEEDTDFHEVCPPGANAGLLVSVCAAPDMQALSGWYGVELKQGKVGPAMGNGVPFKAPFLCVQEGAVLTAVPEVPCILQGIHPNPALAQVTYPLTFSCRVTEEADYATD